MLGRLKRWWWMRKHEIRGINGQMRLLLNWSPPPDELRRQNCRIVKEVIPNASGKKTAQLTQSVSRGDHRALTSDMTLAEVETLEIRLRRSGCWICPVESDNESRKETL